MACKHPKEAQCEFRAGRGRVLYARACVMCATWQFARVHVFGKAMGRGPFGKRVAIDSPGKWDLVVHIFREQQQEDARVHGARAGKPVTVHGAKGA